MSYSQQSRFGLECSPLEIHSFISESPCKCLLCSFDIYQGHSIANKLIFCNDCFEELKLAISLLIIQEEELN